MYHISHLFFFIGPACRMSHRIQRRNGQENITMTYSSVQVRLRQAVDAETELRDGRLANKQCRPTLGRGSGAQMPSFNRISLRAMIGAWQFVM